MTKSTSHGLLVLRVTTEVFTLYFTLSKYTIHNSDLYYTLYMIGFIVEKRPSYGGDFEEIASFQEVSQLISKGAGGGRYVLCIIYTYYIIH